MSIGRLMGLDVGEKRIGVAVSDPLGITAQPLETIVHKNRDEDVRRVCALAREYGVETVVVGLPLNMNGSKGFQAERAERFAEALRRSLDKPVVLWDERLTSAQAEKAMIDGGVRRNERRKHVDSMAAQFILSSYMEQGRVVDSVAKDMDETLMDGYEDDGSVVELIDEDGRAVKFEHITTIEHEGGEYVMLAPLEGMEDDEDDELGLVVLRIVPGDGEDTYEGVEDEALLAALYQRYVEEAELEGFDE